jgi:hypothetical protein
VYVCVCMCMYVYVCVCMYVCVRICMISCTQILSECVHGCTVCICIYVVYMHVYIFCIYVVYVKLVILGYVTTVAVTTRARRPHYYNYFKRSRHVHAVTTRARRSHFHDYFKRLGKGFRGASQIHFKINSKKAMSDGRFQVSEKKSEIEWSKVRGSSPGICSLFHHGPKMLSWSFGALKTPSHTSFFLDAF